MTGCRPHRTEHREVAADLRRQFQFGRRMAGCRDQREIRAHNQSRKQGRRQVQSVRPCGSGEAGIAIDQHLRAILMAKIDSGMDEAGAARRVERGFPQLHQLKAIFQGADHGQQLGVDADFAGMGDRIEFGQDQGREHRRVGRKHGCYAYGIGSLPGQRTMHVVVQFAAPFPHPVEIEPYMGVLIDMLATQPGVGTQYPDAKFLQQFAHQGGMRRFTAFDLTTGELPEPGVEAAWRSLSEKKLGSAIRCRPLDDGSRDFNDAHFFGLAWRPA